MKEAKRPKYGRILLKLSGEALGGQHGLNISPQAVRDMAQQIREVRDLGVQVVVVVGGGNIFRGLSGSERGIERATGDYMGMLATIINALALQDSLEKIGVATRVQSAISMAQVAEAFIRRRAVRHLEEGPGGHLRRRHRQSLLLHRHRSGVARERNRRRSGPQGHEGGRHLRQRPQEEPGRPSGIPRLATPRRCNGSLR